MLAGIHRFHAALEPHDLGLDRQMTILEMKKRILIVQDKTTTEQLSQILGNENYELFEATLGSDIRNDLARYAPDLVILEAELPGFDGLDFSRQVRQSERSSDLRLLMLTSKSDIKDKMAGYEAGIDDYLTKPFLPQELEFRIKILVERSPRKVEPSKEPVERGRVVALFGTKGGVGRTTIAVNLSVALRRRSGARVMLFDADFFFGDLALHLNLSPSHTIVDLIDHIDQLDSDLIEQVMIRHPSGIDVLISPRSPENVESITVNHIQRLLEAFARIYDYIIIDCQSSYDERMLWVLEKADAILLVVKPEVGCVKNMAVFSELAAKLGFPIEKIHIVLNRSGTASGIDAKEIERIFRRQIAFHISSGGRSVVVSVNRGIPLAIEHPNHAFSLQVGQIADFLVKNLPL